jgi:hypothetical protein
MRIGLVAEPWWVNLAVLIPAGAYLFWRRHPVRLAAKQLLVLAIFAAAFGFLEATVVVYLRAATGLLPGNPPAPETTTAAQSQLLREIPPNLLRLETFREAATMLMLIGAALLIPEKARSRLAAFLWVFAIWDILYYASLSATIGWPQSLGDGDVLFLIPEPWLAPVWFPLLVSALTLLAVLLGRARAKDPIVEY